MELILKNVERVKQLFFQHSLAPDFGNFRFYTNRLGCACVNSILHLQMPQSQSTGLCHHKIGHGCPLSRTTSQCMAWCAGLVVKDG